MRRSTTLLLTMLMLNGCATVRFTTVYCLKRDQFPTAEQCAGKAPVSAELKALCEPPKVKDRLTGQADKDLTIVAGSAIRLRAYGEGLRTILEGCRDPWK